MPFLKTNIRKNEEKNCNLNIYSFKQINKKMTIFFVILISCFFFCKNDSEFLEVSKLWKNSFENYYQIEIFIGSPLQFLPIRISFFSFNMDLYCSNESNIYYEHFNDYFFYLPLLSKTSVFFQNEFNLQNRSQIKDNLIFKDSKIVQNNLTINCNSEKQSENQSVGLFSPLFFLEKFPFILLCFHENGGYINLMNETIKNPILNSLMIKAIIMPLIIFNSSNFKNDTHSLGFVCENIGFKINNVFLLTNLQQFNVFLSDSLSFHYFSTNIYLVLMDLLKREFLIGYDSFLNDPNCFLINDIKTEFPTLILTLNNSEFLELNPEDYLKFYKYQKVVCLNFRENNRSSENFLSTKFLSNAFIQIDTKKLSLQIIYQNCETNNLRSMLSNHSSTGIFGNSINQIIINVLIAMSCLVLFLGVIYSFYFVKIWLQSINFSNKINFLLSKRGSGKILKKKTTEKNLLTADLTELKLEIIKDSQKNKKKPKNIDKKRLYIANENDSEKLINKPSNFSKEKKNKFIKKMRKNKKHLKNNFDKEKELEKIKEIDEYEEKKE